MINSKSAFRITVTVIAISILLVFVFSLVSCSFFEIMSEIKTSEPELQITTDNDETTSAASKSASNIQFRVNDNGQLEWKDRSVESSDWAAVSQGEQKPVTFRVNEGYVQWGYEGTNKWTNLISVEQLKADTFGDIKFRIADGYLQYGYDGTDDWTNIMSADSLNINNYFVDTSSDYASGYSMRSVVSIICSFDVTTTYYDLWHRTYTNETEKQSSAGSGVIYKLNEETGEAYIITNYHVVYNASADNQISQEINVYLYGSETGENAIKATYIGGAMSYDIAVLHIESSDILSAGFAKAADIGNSNDIYVGENVIAVGNPEGSGIAVTGGIINVDSEYTTMTLADEKTTGTMRLIRIDAAINPGNSGGGLFDMSGKFIGITNAKLVDSTIDNVGYVIPSNIATGVADSIIYYCGINGQDSAYRCLIGVTVAAEKTEAIFDSETGEAVIYETVVISEFSDSSIAKDILKKKDIVKSVSINGKKQEITRTFILVDSLLSARVGDIITMEIERDGNTVTVKLEVNESCLSAMQ